MIQYSIVRTISWVDVEKDQKLHASRVPDGNHEVHCLKTVGKKLHSAPNYRVGVRWTVSGAGAVHGVETSPAGLNAGRTGCDLELLSACGYTPPAWRKWTLDIWKKSWIRCKTLAGMTGCVIDEGNIPFPPHCIILPSFLCVWIRIPWRYYDWWHNTAKRQ